MSQYPEERFLTVGECAALVRVSPKTIYAMISKKRIPFRRVGKRVVFLYSEILNWTQPTKRKE